MAICVALMNIQHTTDMFVIFIHRILNEQSDILENTPLVRFMSVRWEFG